MHRSGEPTQVDETFESLLSSQRALLQELQKRVAAEQNTVASAPPKKALGRRASIDLARRLSLGSSEHLCISVHEITPESGHKKRLTGVQKRRLSDLGMVCPDIFEDNLKAQRRSSLLSLSMPSGHSIRMEDFGASTHSFQLGFGTMHSLIGMGSKDTEQEDDNTDSDFDEFAEDDETEEGVVTVTKEESVADDKMHKDDTRSGPKIETNNRSVDISLVHPRAKMNPAKYKAFVESLVTAMERSQKTQQNIHDWDRKMGLKRSHSKTMRSSTRSRKKLRTMLRKELVTWLS